MKTVTVKIELPLELARSYSEAKTPISFPIPPERFGEAIGEHIDPRKRFSQLDELIAEILDQGEPLTAEQIARRLEDELDHFTTAAGVRDRFRSTRPLRVAGYERTKDGYTSPNHVDPAEPYTGTEQGILDVLDNVGSPMMAEELAACEEVGVSPEHLIRILSPNGRLRREGVVKHKKKAGYYTTSKPSPRPLMDVDQAIIDLLKRTSAPMTAVEIAQGISNSHDYVRERLAPGAELRTGGLVGHRRGAGYYI